MFDSWLFSNSELDYYDKKGWQQTIIAYKFFSRSQLKVLEDMETELVKYLFHFFF